MKKLTSILLLLFCSLFFIATLSNRNNSAAVNFNIVHAMNKPSQTFSPIEQQSPAALPLREWHASVYERLAEARSARELFNLEQFIVLEVTPESVLGRIQDALFLDGYWFVIDNDGNQVWRFDQQGRFAGHLSRQGQGPGEYQYAISLKRVFNNQLAVLDSMTGAIHVYTADGEHITSTPQRGEKTGGRYPYGRSFVWDQQDRLIYSNILSFKADDPWHGIYEVSWPDGTFSSEPHLQLRNGFGEKFTYYHEAVRTTIDFSAFTQVAGQLWVGSPFSSQIEIYDMQGRFMQTLEPACRNCLSEDTFREQPKSYWQKHKYSHNLFSIKGRNIAIDQVGELVFVFHGIAGFTVYGIDGQLLATHHLKNDLGLILDVQQDRVATRAMLPEQANMNDETLQKLHEAGYDFENPDNHNDLLMISTLKPFP